MKSYAWLLLLPVGCKQSTVTTAAGDVESSAGGPGVVGDLGVTSVNDTSVTLSFTGVEDGMGQPAHYDIRYATPTIGWGSALAVIQGSCATPFAGTNIGSAELCTVG